MREPSVDIEKKEELLRKCFECMVESGLESVSLRKLCEEADMSMSSAYYWFGNKEGMILNAAEWGLRKVSNELFDYVYKYRNNLECIILTFPEIAIKYKNELRFVFQVATSQKYGDKMRPLANRLSMLYGEYAEMLADYMQANKHEVLQYIHLFISAVLDYVVWHDKEKIEMELACIIKALKELSNN